MGSDTSKFVDVEVTKSYDYSDKGYLIYKLKNPGFEQRVSLSYKNPKFAELKPKLLVGSFCRCAISRHLKEKYHHKDHTQLIPEFIDVLPVPCITITGKVHSCIPYNGACSEVILERRPVKIAKNQWYARLIVETQLINTIPCHVDVDLAIKYAGDNNYEVKEVNVIKHE